MRDRVVKVELRALVSGFKNDMAQARQAAKELNREVQESAAKNAAAWNTVGTAATAVGLAAAAAAGLAIAKWATFDQAMSAVKAATHETEGNMRLLEQAALDAGARTVFSATEAAGAIEELAKAGVSTRDILAGGLDGALDLAAAGGLGVAEAAGIAATALKTFQLEGQDMAHVADLLAAGAGKAMGDVTDLAAAMNQSAMVANATGLSIEETTAGLAAFASQGLLGSDAGTSFKSMLQSLTPTSKAAKTLMDDLGISAYDAQGEFIGLAEFAGVLRGALEDMSTEQQQATLKTIFGSDAIRAATVLYSEGEDGIRDWIEAVDDQGYAAETAAARLDNLMGDLEALGGAFDTALIQTGSHANDVLRDMVQWLTGLIDFYNELPAPLQGAVLGVGLLTAGVGLLTGAVMLGLPKYVEFKNALSQVAPVGSRTRGMLGGIASFLGGPWGVALAAAGLALHALNVQIEEGVPSQENLRNALLTSADAALLLRQASDRSGVEQFFWGDYAQSLEDLPALMDDVAQYGHGFWSALSFNQNGAVDSLARVGEALAEIAGTDLPRASQEFRDLANSQGLSREQMSTLLGVMPEFKDALTAQATELGLTADDATLLQLALGEIGPAAERGAAGADSQTSSLEGLQGVAEDTTGAIERLADEIRGFGQAQFDVERAAIQFQDSLAKLDEQLASGTASLDITTEAGRETSSALLDVASAANENAASIAAVGGTTEQIQAALEAGRQKIIDTRIALGDSEEAARSYADRLIATPEAIHTRVELDTDIARARLNEWLATIPGVIPITADVSWVERGHMADGGILEHADGGVRSYADGGYPPGIYRGRPGALYKFAEPETRWEAFISGKPGMEEQNRAYALEALNRLGGAPSTGPMINLTVQAAPGMNEYELVERAVQRIREVL